MQIPQKLITLLYLRKFDIIGEEKILEYHYVWIKHFSRLVGCQLTRHNGKIFVYDGCIHFFHSEEKLRDHIGNCEIVNKCRIRLPTPPAGGENKDLQD